MSTSIFDVDEQGYIYDEALRERTKELRDRYTGMLGQEPVIYSLAHRPTMRMEPEDERHVMRHVHEGDWTIGLHEEDLPGFVAEEVHP